MIAIPAFLFIAFLWFLISPILLDATIIAPAARRRRDVDTEGLHSIEDQRERDSLLSWMRRSSRGRFADTKGNNDAHNVSHHTQGRSKAHHRFSLSTFFARSSLVPHIATVTPPPIYTITPADHFAPAISSPLAIPPLECAPEHRQLLTVPRIFIPARRISLRSISGPVLPSMMSTFRPQMAPRSVSDSQNTPLPFSGTIACLPSRLPAPSKALVLARESPGSNVSVRLPVAETRTDAEPPIANISRALRVCVQ
jgi:hypothetical protein